jgi:hypothetical protein
MADVTDAENLAKAVLDRQLRLRGSHLRADEYDDALALCRAELVDLYSAWDPGRGVRFTAYATGLLRLRVNNWWRQELGHKTPKAHFGALSLDAERVDASEQADEWGPSTELEAALTERQGDPEVDRGADLYWALAKGGRILVSGTSTGDLGRRRRPARAPGPGDGAVGGGSDA